MSRISDFTPIAALPATGGIVPVADAGANYSYDLGARLGQTVNILDYIPTALHAAILAGTSTTDVSSYINAAVAYAKTLYAPEIVLPRGSYYITHTAVFELPWYTRMEFIGTIVAAVPNGTAVRIGTTSLLNDDRKLFLRVRGLSVLNAVDDTSGSSVGVELINCSYCDFEITRISGFYTGLLCNGTNPYVGFAVNQLALLYVVNNKKNIHLTASGGGWCNENTFFGGEISWSGDYTGYDANCIGITIDDFATILNNNRFLCSSFELNSTLPRVAVIGGRHNSILHCRLENAINQNAEMFVFTASSVRNELKSRNYQLIASNINDGGSENEYETTQGSSMFRATPSGAALLALQGSVSNGARLLQGKTITGGVSSWIEAVGRAFFSQYVYAETGLRFSTSDGSLIDRGIFAGLNSPNSQITASVGSLYLQTNGGASTTLWVKESGTLTNTGWVAK